LLKQIRRDDGSIIYFSYNRTLTTVEEQLKSLGVDNGGTAESITREVVEIVKNIEEPVVDVTFIEKAIANSLANSGFEKASQEYLEARNQKRMQDSGKEAFMKIQHALDQYVSRDDWKVKENSNESYSFSGLRQSLAAKLIGYHALSKVYPPSVSLAHRKGYMHIHDMSCAIIPYCAGWSMGQLLMKGFGGVPGKIKTKPAKHMDVAINQVVNFFGCLQMEFAGAQAFSSIDTYLAPFVKTDKLTYKQIKQNMQKLVFHLNVTSRWGSQTVFSNLTFDLTTPSDLKNVPAIVAGKEQSFCYGDCQEESDLINKAFFEVMSEGDASERVFTFPIPTYNLTKDFDWDSELADSLFKMTSKYGSPYFQNYIGSGLDPNSIRAMCCRLSIDLRQLQHNDNALFGSGELTGSLGVVTVNLNRLAYESHSKEEFFARIKEHMELAKESLEIKREMVDVNMKRGLIPYAKVYLGTLKNHFSTIGLIGMNEACINLLGESIASPAGKKLAIDTMNVMRDKILEFQKETGHLYNLEATPGEGTAYRLAKLDKAMYPKIVTAGQEFPYLTNSTQLPVGYTDDVFEAVNHQEDIQPLYTGGTVFHTFLGESIDAKSCKLLVQKLAKSKLPYYTLTPTFSICPNHGYLKGEVRKCPNCGQVNEVFSRVVGYLRPISFWNEGKVEEYNERKVFAN